MKKISIDICVIGAGSGGLTIAAGAAQMGAKVILIEQGKMGGECLNSGCVPSKSIISYARNCSNKPADYQQVYDYVHDVIAKIAPHDSVARFKKLGVQTIKGVASFVSPKVVQVKQQQIKARYFVIATGSAPAAPPMPGLDKVDYLTNETIFELKEQPNHLIVLGGGPIGCEMAQAHRMLGTKVSLVQRTTILNKDDPDVVAVVRVSLVKTGVKLYEQSSIKKISEKSGKITVALDNHKITGSHLLVAVGRTPNVAKLNLIAAKVNFNSHGVVVNGRLRSSNKRVFAIGDVAGGPKFTHAASYQAGVVLRNMLFHLPAKVNYRALPWVTFTQPELANVGMHETQAREQYKNIKVLTAPFSDNDRAQTEADTSGMIKVVTTKKGEILGATIVGRNAGDLIQPWVLAMNQKLKIGALAQMIAPYPTRGEINKQVAGSFYTEMLFSKRMRKIVRFLLRWF